MFLTDGEKTGPDGEEAERLARLAAQEELTRRLDKIERLLRRMIVLAELSASDMDVDREVLQNAFERLRGEVKSIADGIDI